MTEKTDLDKATDERNRLAKRFSDCWEKTPDSNKILFNTEMDKIYKSAKEQDKRYEIIDKIKSLDNPSSFMFSGHISSGLDLLSKTKWGLRIAVHYRYSLTNTFTKYGDYIHKPYGLGYSMSLTKKL